jgi:hypothetical protein
MTTILFPLGLYGGNRKVILPLLYKLGYTPPKGTWRNLRRITIRLMPRDRTLLILDASLAIPTYVLCSEGSRSHHGAHRLDLCTSPVIPA